MTGTILSRLVWKEYRLLRGFWWAMLAAAVLGQLYALWMFSNSPTSNAPSIFLIGIALTACYALGCGATAFAGERETGTYALQQLLPVNPPTVLLGKMLFAVLSSLALGVLLWCIATLLVYLRWHIGAGSYGELALLGALKTTELLVWGVFFSLLSARPLRAVVLAGLASVAVSYPLAWLLSDIPQYARGVFYFPSFLGDSATVIPRVIVVALVAACDLYLVTGWFGESKGDAEAVRSRDAARKQRARSLTERMHLNPVYQRLLWQTLVDSRWTLITAPLAYLILLPLTFAFWPVWSMAGEYNPVEMIDSRQTELYRLLFLATLVPVAGLIGVSIFANDQRQHQFRFFAEHGIAPRRVWWTRQAFWAAVVLLIMVVVSTTELVDQWRYIDAAGFWPDFRTMCLLILTVYAAGQLGSLWLRSTILAGAVTLVLTAAFVMWFQLVTLGGVSVWGAIVPIPCAMLLATWWTADDWIKERSRGIALVRKTALLLAPAILVITFAILFRWQQIPVVTPEFTGVPLSYEHSVEGAKTGELYQQLFVIDNNAPPDEDIQFWANRKEWGSPSDVLTFAIPESTANWLADNQDAMQELAQVAQRERFYWPVDLRSSRGPHNIFPVDKIRLGQGLMIVSARQHQQRGELDEASDQYLAALRMGRHMFDAWSLWGYGFANYREGKVLHYLRYWAGEPGQTSERIHRTVKALQKEWADPVPYEVNIQNERARRLLALEAVSEGQDLGPAFYTWFYRLLPWERVRIQRLINADAAYQLEIVRTWRSSRDQNVAPRFDNRWQQQLEAWAETTPNSLSYDYGMHHSREVDLVGYETLRRGTLLVLALEGWRLEHGELPETLKELVPDWFDELPLDPSTAQPFDYYPRGHGKPLIISNYAGIWQNYSSNSNKLTLPPRAPYLAVPIPGRNHPDLVVVFPVP